MNEIVKAPTRRKWTLAELDRLSALGFFGEHEHVELIRGELLTIPAEGIRQERIRGIVSKWLSRQLPVGFDHYQELGWRPGQGIYLEPDLLFAFADAMPPAIPPEKVALIVEFAKSSLDYDLGLKAQTYADLEIPDYWVVDAVSLTIRVHRAPTPQGFNDIVDVPVASALQPHLIPGLSVCLADFDFGTEGLAEDDP